MTSGSELKTFGGSDICDLPNALREHELEPNVDWGKGKAALHLLNALGLDGDDVMALCLGDDLTDEDAFAALAGRGIGIFVGSVEDPEVAARRTLANYALASTREVQRFPGMLARGS